MCYNAVIVLMSIHLIEDRMKNTAAPLYIQVKRWIISQIEDGHYSIGTRIPGEHDLSRQLNISRGTIREAIRELVDEGYLYTIHGRGTFVKNIEKPSWAMNTFASVADSFDDANIHYSTRIMDNSRDFADSVVAAQLHIEPQTEIIRLERLRFIKEEPVHLSTSFLPYSTAEKLLSIDLNNKSLYKVMGNDLGIKVVRVERVVMAKLADSHEVDLLQLPDVAAILVMDGVAYNEFNKPVEYSVARFPTERSRFIVQSKHIIV